MTTRSEQLQADAKSHLWLHFARMGAYAEKNIPIIDRGEGCYLYDIDGKRYLDGLSGLFTVQVGHGRQELAEAAATQAARLSYFPLWSYAHPPAIELATRLAELAPGNLNRVFFTSGGSESVESAWKLARTYFKLIGQPLRTKVISRNTAYHGTTLGALSITGVPALRMAFEPLVPGARHVANTNEFRCTLCAEQGSCNLQCANDIERAILMEGAESVAAVFLEPVQNAGGCYPPPPGYFQQVREICDRYGVLLVSDEVICAFGRLGEMFGCERYGYQPDIITTAKGLTSGYSPLGAVIIDEHIMKPFLEGINSFAHGLTFGGHPVGCAVGMANLDIFEREGLLQHVRDNTAVFKSKLDGLRDIPLVGDVRGDGYFWAIELVKDQATKVRFTRPETEALLRGFLAPRLYELGLICRTDDRGDPVLQFSPPLIAGEEELEFIVSTVRTALTEAVAKVA